MNSKRAMAQLLKHLSSAGVTHLPKVTIPKPSRIGTPARLPSAVAETTPSTVVSAPANLSSAGKSVSRAASRLASATAVPDARRPASALISPNQLRSPSDQPGNLAEVQSMTSKTFSSVEEKNDALCRLKGIVAACQRCTDLAPKRKQTVFGVGNPNAEIMFIGEAPGAEEDASGEPFVGPAGQLLNKIVEACHLKREDIYICNILRCRPPGNRNPLPQEAANCREFLDAQIHIVEPKYIICWGTVAAQNLLNETQAVGKLRGRFFEYRGIKVMCTYHPSYLLRNPAAKKQVWEDMKFFMKDRGVELQ